VAVTLEDLRARVDPAVLGGIPATVPTLDSLKARVSGDMGRAAPIPRRKPPRVSEDLIEAMISAESGGDPNAVSPAGAQGLMQLMPRTARHLGVEHPLEPEENLMGGIRYLRSMLDRYGDLHHALAAYNAGPTAVDRYRGVPPYPETKAYVARVLNYYRGYHSHFRRRPARRPATAPQQSGTRH